MIDKLKEDEFTSVEMIFKKCQTIVNITVI